MKHTPGPWHVRTLDGSIGSIDDKNNDTVAQAMEIVRGDLELRKANAQLIAAAPELLEALQLIAQDQKDGIHCIRIKQVLAAIAKATNSKS